MKKVSKIQREWIAWILWDQRDWLDKEVGVAEKGMILLQKAYLNEEYEEDGPIEWLLNHTRTEFNNNMGLVNKWKGRHEKVK
jgi:hypothetical protein